MKLVWLYLSTENDQNSSNNAKISLCELWYFCCVLSSFKYCDYLTTWISSSGRSTVFEPNILKTWTKRSGIQVAALFLYVQRELFIQYIIFGYVSFSWVNDDSLWRRCWGLIFILYCYILRFGKGSPYGSGFSFAYMGNAKSILLGWIVLSGPCFCAFCFYEQELAFYWIKWTERGKDQKSCFKFVIVGCCSLFYITRILCFY